MFWGVFRFHFTNEIDKIVASDMVEYRVRRFAMNDILFHVYYIRVVSADLYPRIGSKCKYCFICTYQIIYDRFISDKSYIWEFVLLQLMQLNSIYSRARVIIERFFWGGGVSPGLRATWLCRGLRPVSYPPWLMSVRSLDISLIYWDMFDHSTVWLILFYIDPFSLCRHLYSPHIYH